MGWIDAANSDVVSAVGGDSAALERIVAATQTPVYNLALRFLWHPQDAQDNTQEILIRIITNLSSFKHESSYSTWAYRIAVNHLLRAKKSRAERREVSFRMAGHEIDAVPDSAGADTAAIIHDVKIACSHGMLLCLKRPYRMAFVLGTVFELAGDEAAAILNITPDAYRQRLSRARGAMAEFLGRHCGLVGRSARCHCSKRTGSRGSAKIEPYLAVANDLKDSGDFARTEKLLGAEIRQIEKVALLYRSNGEYRVPENLSRRIRSVFSGKLFNA